MCCKKEAMTDYLSGTARKYIAAFEGFRAHELRIFVWCRCGRCVFAPNINQR